jgi:hydrogenase maturation protein HypF
VSHEELSVWKQQCKGGLNCPFSSGAGRLFDSVAALLGCAPQKTTYEGQPAIRLEAAAKRAHGLGTRAIPFRASEVNGLLEIDWSPFFSSVPDVAAARQAVEDYAMSFHTAIINASAAMVDYGLSKYPEEHIALSGGVFMNRILHTGITERISNMKLKPVTHRQLPPNDGCISFGQVVSAGYRIRNEGQKLQ